MDTTTEKQNFVLLEPDAFTHNHIRDMDKSEIEEWREDVKQAEKVVYQVDETHPWYGRKVHMVITEYGRFYGEKSVFKDIETGEETEGNSNQVSRV